IATRHGLLLLKTAKQPSLALLWIVGPFGPTPRVLVRSQALESSCRRRHCIAVIGTTESRGNRTRSHSARGASALIWPSVTAFGKRRTGSTRTATAFAFSPLGSVSGSPTAFISPTTAFSFPV